MVKILPWEIIITAYNVFRVNKKTEILFKELPIIY